MIGFVIWCVVGLFFVGLGILHCTNCFWNYLYGALAQFNRVSPALYGRRNKYSRNYRSNPYGKEIPRTVDLVDYY